MSRFSYVVRTEYSSKLGWTIAIVHFCIECDRLLHCAFFVSPHHFEMRDRTLQKNILRKGSGILNTLCKHVFFPKSILTKLVRILQHRCAHSIRIRSVQHPVPSLNHLAHYIHANATSSVRWPFASIGSELSDSSVFKMEKDEISSVII